MALTIKQRQRDPMHDRASKDLMVLGTSFRTAGASTREILSFSESEAGSLLRDASRRIADSEAVILSTCNRSELYLAVPSGSEAVEAWLQHVGDFRGSRAMMDTGYPHYQLDGVEAARHLFRVTCGLDSAVLGDLQIQGQVRRAMVLSSECGTLGKYLQRAFTLALEAGALARQRTTISSGAASISSALVSILHERLSSISGPARPKVLVIGAGEIASEVTRHLVKRQLGGITIANRTEATGRTLANAFGVSAVPWPSLWTAIEDADIVIAATASREPILAREPLDATASRRATRSLLIVDAGLPRNVEPTSSVDIIDIDAIRERREQTLAEREAAVPEAERIVSDQLLLWERWLGLQPLEDSLKALYRMASQASQEAVEQLLELGSQDPNAMKRVVLQLVKRVLHHHVRTLRDFAPALARFRPGQSRLVLEVLGNESDLAERAER